MAAHTCKAHIMAVSCSPPGELGKLSFSMEIPCWAPWAESIGRPFFFLKHNFGDALKSLSDPNVSFWVNYMGVGLPSTEACLVMVKLGLAAWPWISNIRQMKRWLTTAMRIITKTIQSIYFANSKLIRWKTAHFASLISPSTILLFEEHQAFDTVFHHQMKHSVSCLI